jgi:hypothetical protein
MNLSYREKSIWGSLLAILIVYGSYFGDLFQRGRGFGGGSVSGLVMAVVAVVVIEVAYHIAISIMSRPEGKDERDILIEGKAYRVGYILLVSCVFMASWGLMLSPDKVRPLAVVNLTLLCVVIAETSTFGAQLFLYRRGV